MAAQQFFLRWDNFSTHITTAFGTLRNQEDFVDVTLSCEGKKIRAHKVLLSACSTYFREVFKDNPCPHPVIVFKNVKYEDLLAIVEFMYQGEVNVVQDSLPSFLHTAELLSVQGLTEGGNNNSSSSHTILESAQPSSTHIITPKTVTLKSPQMNIQPERRFVRKVMPAQATTLKTVTHPITLVSSKMISPITKKVTSGVPASSKPNSTTLVTAQDPLSGSSPVVKRKRFVIDSDENISFEGVNYMKQEDYSMKIDLPEFIEIRTTDDGKGTTTTDMSNVVTDEMMSGTESDNPSQENVIIEEVENYDTTNEEEDDTEGGHKSGMEIKYAEDNSDGTVVLTQVIEDDGKGDEEKQMNNNLVQGGDGTTKWSVCNHCKLVITTVNLWRHIRTQHTPQPPRICDHCQKQFKNKYSLREHIRIAHEQKGGDSSATQVKTEPNTD